MHLKSSASCAQRSIWKPLLTGLIVGATLLLTACGSVPPKEDHIVSSAPPAAVNATEVMFIHGMFVTAKSWEPWLPVFEKAGYTVSAPPWPAHPVPVERTRAPENMAALGKLELVQVLDYYRKLLKDKPVKPILVGHSMGGLVAQILLQEGLAQAAVVIDSAPPKGIVFVSGPFLKANWKLINPLTDANTPVAMTRDEFAYAFASQQTDAVVDAAYATQVVPESHHLATDALTAVGAVDASMPRGPLLMIAGEKDHIIPAALNYKNFDIYRSTPANTDFMMFPERDHWLIAGAGWEEVAAQTLAWIQKQKRN